LTEGGLFHTTFFLEKYLKHLKQNKNMARDNKIRMPSGQGGLTRYFDEYRSKIEFSPATVIVISIVTMIIIILLHYFGNKIFFN
tara:strand:- start:9 stop:260 length:252 start_codon:yes stop_codon:yes gene_type:complete